MSTANVRVGDHDPELRANARRAAELHFVRKLAATAIELRALTQSFDEVTRLFLFAQADENLARTMDAGHHVLRVADQIAFLSGGIKSALEAIPSETQEYRYHEHR